jgi:hypothetical protein
VRAANPVALREWAVLCDRLGTGDQILLLRAGGIHERAFRGGQAPVEHREFWLLPTYLHAAAQRLVPAARERFERVAARAPPEDRARIDWYAEVTDAVFVDDRARLPALEPFHPYDAGYVRDRFDFREPGLWAIVLRVHRRPEPHELALGPEHSGCVSWVRVDPAPSMAGLEPVLDDASFEHSRGRLRHVLEPGDA